MTHTDCLFRCQDVPLPLRRPHPWRDEKVAVRQHFFHFLHFFVISNFCHLHGVASKSAGVAAHFQQDKHFVLDMHTHEL